MGDKEETSGNSCGPRKPEWETSVGGKSGKQVGDKCKLMRPKAPRVRDKEETSVNSCVRRQPEWERQGGDKCKLMRPKEPSVGDNCGRQV